MMATTTINTTSATQQLPTLLEAAVTGSTVDDALTLALTSGSSHPPLRLDPASSNPLQADHAATDDAGLPHEPAHDSSTSSDPPSPSPDLQPPLQTEVERRYVLTMRPPWLISSNQNKLLTPRDMRSLPGYIKSTQPPIDIDCRREDNILEGASWRKPIAKRLHAYFDPCSPYLVVTHQEPRRPLDAAAVAMLDYIGELVTLADFFGVRHDFPSYINVVNTNRFMRELLAVQPHEIDDDTKLFRLTALAFACAEAIHHHVRNFYTKSRPTNLALYLLSTKRLNEHSSLHGPTSPYSWPLHLDCRDCGYALRHAAHSFAFINMPKSDYDERFGTADPDAGTEEIAEYHHENKKQWDRVQLMRWLNANVPTNACGGLDQNHPIYKDAMAFYHSKARRHIDDCALKKFLPGDSHDYINGLLPVTPIINPAHREPVEELVAKMPVLPVQASIAAVVRGRPPILAKYTFLSKNQEIPFGTSTIYDPASHEQSMIMESVPTLSAIIFDAAAKVTALELIRYRIPRKPELESPARLSLS